MFFFASLPTLQSMHKNTSSYQLLSRSFIQKLFLGCFIGLHEHMCIQSRGTVAARHVKYCRYSLVDSLLKFYLSMTIMVIMPPAGANIHIFLTYNILGKGHTFRLSKAHAKLNYISAVYKTSYIVYAVFL